jgi:anti-sigma factor RsiW
MGAQRVVCRELVELVTEYLDDALPPDLRAAVGRHLDGCDGCVEYVRQLLYLADAARSLGAPGQ